MPEITEHKGPKVIAFYLPQYHPTPDNDKWWGKGFTEWTNVAKAKPLFKGHYQPHIPADLGFYDLRLPEVREVQAELAKEAGIYGFCYYHYWFGNGKEELELPFDEVLKLGKPDFPFMLCWANESWHKKFWNKDGEGTSKELLVEQLYPGEQDIIDHFYRLLPAFKDHRYICIDGKLAFMIYKAFDHPDLRGFTRIWQSLAKKENLPGFYFITQKQFAFEMGADEIEVVRKYHELGITSLNVVRLYEATTQKNPIKKMVYRILRRFANMPRNEEYSKTIKKLDNKYDEYDDVYPTLIPNWDHTPRSGKGGLVLKNSTPELFEKHIERVFLRIKNKPDNKKIVFLKSWNEWGEGNYLEPDLIYGKAYIRTLKNAIIKDYESKS